MKRLLGFVTVLVAVSSMTVSAADPTIVYDNSTNYLAQYFGTTNEFGDQIKLIDGVERLVTSFKFEYWTAHGMSGDEQVQVRMYDNDGIDGTPGELLYDSGKFNIGSGYRTVELNGLEVMVPDSFTWTVQFTGIQTGELYGLLIYDPPTVGSSYNDFWEKVNGSWGTKTLPETVANFAAQVTAVVPEPTVIQYGLLAGLVGLGAALRRRISWK